MSNRKSWEEVRLSAHLISKDGTLGTKRRVRVNLGANLNEYNKKSTIFNENQRYLKREGLPCVGENALFVENTKVLCTKVRMPKNRQGDKMRKKENCDSRNQSDAKLAGRSMLNSVYELYCKTYGNIEWSKFEKYQSGKSFQKKINAMY